MTTTIFSARPWTHKDGSLLSDEQLKKVSRNWSPETWEQFLTETVEQETSYQRDMPAFVSQAALNSFSETIWEGQDSDRMDQVAKGLRRICRDHLTPQQQQIIRSTYWHGQSERHIGQMLDISRSSVRTQKQRSLEKIKTQIEEQRLLEDGRQVLKKGKSSSTLTKKPIANSSNNEGRNKDTAQEFYHAELEKPQFTFRTGGTF